MFVSCVCLQLVHALVWLMSHSPETPTIEKKSLKGFVEKGK